MSASAFERYAPFIQEYIYRKKWTDLREVQVEACDAIMDTDSHVLIASGTASGKTEAAFFPMLTLLDEKPSNSIGIMYISPLKALINDQFERLGEMLEDVDIPVWSWHGDISQSHKKKALKVSKGVLQITPESLESLLMRHPNNAYKLFSDLRFIVIDEIHALMGVDRGLQVLCLINRLEALIGCAPRRIGLSATLNDYDSAMRFLSSGSNKNAIAVGIQSHKRTISLCVESFIFPRNESWLNVDEKYKKFIYDNCHTKKCLIFTNTRHAAEEIISDMKNEALSRNEQDVFYVHHGSVSAELRKEAEKALKEKSGPTVAAATLTLELGIDIGDLDSTIQLGVPCSCSSFIQRLGRSGRKTGKSQMMFVNRYKDKQTNPYEAMPWDLLQTIAVIQLYLEERWVEPFEQKKKPYSLLAHQTLSMLMSHGELSPVKLAKNVLTLPPFIKTISPDEYKELLQFMIKEDYLQKMDNGGIIVGLNGEKICNFYSFYAVFQDENVFKVIGKNGEIGSLDVDSHTCPKIGDSFILAGKAWIVISIDIERKNIYVNQTRSNTIRGWTGRQRGADHTRIVKRMKKVLQEDVLYSYLQPNAQKLLLEARKIARESGILEHDIIQYTEKTYYLCPWVGTKTLNTIFNLFNCGLKDKLGILSVFKENNYIEFVSDLKPKELVDKLSSLKCPTDDASLILRDNTFPKIDKYDYMVPDNLLRKACLYNEVDIPLANDILNNLIW